MALLLERLLMERLLMERILIESILMERSLTERILRLAASLRIEDILPYIALSPWAQERKILPHSGVQSSPLEMTIQSCQNSIRSEQKSQWGNASARTAPNPASLIIRHDAFLQSDEIGFDAIDITYRTCNGQENIGIGISRGSRKASLALERFSSETFSSEEYLIQFSYNKKARGYHVTYISTISDKTYGDRIEEARQDFTNRLDKALEILPKSLMGGILGFTTIGSGKMARRDDLFGDMALMVDVHEAIHTPDEYETRVLTDWMLRKERPRYKG